MTHRRFLAVALLATVAWTGVASAQFYFDIWPATADGSMDQHWSEGYAIASEGNFRFTKSYHHMTFMGFGPTPYSTYSGYSDGPDGIPQGRQKGGTNDSNDGVLMADWLPGKKAFHASIYFRQSYAQTCDPFAAPGTYIYDPVVVVGFRVSNDGPFVDRGTGPKGTAATPSGFGGCCATYLAPLLEGGENAPPAWRMGVPYVDRAGVKGYSQYGDINEGDAQHEWYKASSADSLYAGLEVKMGQAGFGTTGFGGYATNIPGMPGSGRFAFDYLVEKRAGDGMLVNTATINESDCTGFAGEEEPRDFAGDSTIGEGWYAEIIDRCIIQAMVTPSDVTGIIETKGLVFQTVAIPATTLNNSVFGRDQSGGYDPYLAVTATLVGDGANNDGYVDVVDLLDLVGAFGSAKGDANYNPEVDWNCDTYVDVVDLLDLVGNFGLSVWP